MRSLFRKRALSGEDFNKKGVTEESKTTSQNVTPVKKEPLGFRSLLSRKASGFRQASCGRKPFSSKPKLHTSNSDQKNETSIPKQNGNCHYQTKADCKNTVVVSNEIKTTAGCSTTQSTIIDTVVHELRKSDNETANNKATTLLSATNGDSLPQTNPLVSEISNKARMRRLASNIVDQEYTSETSERSSSDINTKHNTLEILTSSNTLRLTLPIREINKKHVTMTKSATTTSASAFGFQVKPVCSATTTSARTFKRSVACPGFDSADAENELRKALELRKLRTLQKE